MKDNSMDTLEKSIAQAMDCQEKKLVQYLPYIFKDFWEIGTSPYMILQIIKKHKKNFSMLNILDLGCGKGAVLIKLASELHCHCSGIDGIPEFIQEAKSKARDIQVDSFCTFEVNDIRQRIASLPALYFDCIILGSIGPVFGNYYKTLSTLKDHLKDDGIIIIDDGYSKDPESCTHPLIGKKQDIINQVEKAGMHLTDEVIQDANENVCKEYHVQFENIVQRCTELMEMHPEDKTLFSNYIRRQKNEYDALEHNIVCAAMVFKKK